MAQIPEVANLDRKLQSIIEKYTLQMDSKE
jgi:hypothetical protein